VISMSSPLTSMNVEPVDIHLKKEESDVQELFMLLPVRTKE